MLRVGLTGELGSGKSTVARLLAQWGAVVLSSDDMARAMMQPGEPVYRAIVERFGQGVMLPDGSLDRPALARLAFDPAHPRVEELNAIVHPAVIAEQERLLAAIAQDHPEATAVVESALIFSTRFAGGVGAWRARFDAVVLVTAPETVKVARFVERMTGGRPVSASERAALETEAERRLAVQRVPDAVAEGCFVIENAGDLAALRHRTEEVFRMLCGLGDDVQV